MALASCLTIKMTKCISRSRCDLCSALLPLFVSPAQVSPLFSSAPMICICTCTCNCICICICICIVFATIQPTWRWFWKAMAMSVLQWYDRINTITHHCNSQKTNSCSCCCSFTWPVTRFPSLLLSSFLNLADAISHFQRFYATLRKIPFFYYFSDKRT